MQREQINHKEIKSQNVIALLNADEVTNFLQSKEPY